MYNELVNSIDSLSIKSVPMHDRFEQKVTKYIEALSERSDAVREMYYYNPQFENIPVDMSRDILLEKKHTLTKGLVHKFSSRAFILLSYTCAANCRFCERQDRVGVGLDKLGNLKEEEIRLAADYISQHPEINEVIFSGGDPLSNPKGLRFAVGLISTIPHVKIFRIHTKFPMQFPEKIDFELLQNIISVDQAFFFSVHVNHPDELNEITIPVLCRIRKLGFVMLSQSVFLKGINDSVTVLKKLFTTLAETGIRPYYIYHCSRIPTTERFVMDIKDEVAIMTALRESLSGIAYPTHCVDLIGAIGKVIVPTNHWQSQYDSVKDYRGNTVAL